MIDEIGWVVGWVVEGELSVCVDVVGSDGVVVEVGNQLNLVFEVIEFVNGELKFVMLVIVLGDFI